jgi:peptide chain release factor 1
METLYLELHPAAGGQDARQFSQALAQAYLRAATQKGWQAESIETGRNITLRISGQKLTNLLGESGAHRLIREVKGKRHTSIVTLAVLAVRREAKPLDTQDLQIERMRSGGPGGQNVNKIETAIRVTHKPTGLSVYIANERSQAQNLALALELITARVLAQSQQVLATQRNQERQNQLGSGDFAQRRRTYALRANLVTDHRSGQSLSYDQVMAGALYLFWTLGDEKALNHTEKSFEISSDQQ